jgi:hypothetical protein
LLISVSRWVSSHGHKLVSTELITLRFSEACSALKAITVEFSNYRSMDFDLVTPRRDCRKKCSNFGLQVSAVITTLPAKTNIAELGMWRYGVTRNHIENSVEC